MTTKRVTIDSFHVVLGQYAEASLDEMSGEVEIDEDFDSARFIPDDADGLPEGFDDVLFSPTHIDEYNVRNKVVLDGIEEFVEAITK